MMAHSRAVEILTRVFGVPDDGRWHRRETVVDGILISGFMRKTGVSGIEITSVEMNVYTPRVVERTMSETLKLKDYVS